MTALGKTLVFFVLLFSVITMGMMAMGYVTRTNWKIGFENAQVEVKNAFAAQQAERDKFKEKREEYEKTIAVLTKSLEGKATELSGLTAQLSDLEKQNSELIKTAKKEEANNRAATNQIDALSKERDQMKEQITERNTRILGMEKAFVKASDNETQATILAGRLRDENQNLMRKTEDMNNKLNDLKQQGFVPRSGNLKPPPVEVKGTVTAVEGSIAQTSLGKDHGVNVGDDLQVFRLLPTPEYLGKLRISIAREHDSVGTFTPDGRNKMIKKGDTVDTKVLPGIRN